MWESKYHVKSSMAKKDSQYALFIGRWQPLHEGHKQLFRQVLDEGRKVCVAIREMEPNEKNPYTAREVMVNICKELEKEINSGNIKIIIIPDICSVEFGRGVGYDIIEHIPPPEIGEISATKIRESMKNNENVSTK